MNAYQKESRAYWLIIFVITLSLLALPLKSFGQKKVDKERVMIKVGDPDIATLGLKLQQFEGQLSQPEIKALYRIYWRAATAPVSDRNGTNVTGSFFDVGGPVIADQNGDRGPGRPPGQPNVSPRMDILVAQDREPNRPPPPPPPDKLNSLSASLAVGTAGPFDPGPIPPDALNGFAGKLTAFGSHHLTRNEKGIMDWLLDRAGQTSIRESPRSGTPGGKPPTLQQALGIAAFGTRQPAGGGTWVLKIM